MSPNRRQFLGMCAALGLPALLPDEVRADLAGYVGKPDPSFAWKLVTKEERGSGTVHRLRLTSQTWQGIVWEHDLSLYLAEGTTLPQTIALYNTGGGANATNDLMGMDLARRSKVPIAFLYHVPNQPLFEGKKEDALIAETFLRYLKTGDDTWPLLFPMVKSVVRAMDALQAYGRQEMKSSVERFVVSGASKRGWTSWLTAASGDRRVKAIAPMVIDTLNMPAQIKHQREAFGTTSEQIRDYSETGLTEAFATETGRKLMRMVDPFAYRGQLTLPKMLIHGANDPYWTADAIRLYWDELKGDKWVCYVPNAGHNLIERTPGKDPSPERALSALAAFIRSQAGGSPLPRLSVKETEAKGEPYRLEVRTDRKPEAVRLWVVRSETQDFRPKTWEEMVGAVTSPEERTRVFTVERPASGYLACFAELSFSLDGATSPLCTLPKVLAGA